MSGCELGSAPTVGDTPRLRARLVGTRLVLAATFAACGLPGARDLEPHAGPAADPVLAPAGQAPGGSVERPRESAADSPPTRAADRPAGLPYPKLETAQAELARAGAWKRRARTLRGGERLRALACAVDAYRATSAHWSDQPMVAAEAAFRAGEVLRALERDSEARTQFERSKTLGASTSFASRAGLEIGHLARRAGDVEGARDAYAAVARDERGERRYRDDATLWAARMEHELGRSDVARHAFEALARSAESALDRIAAYDEWCSSFVDCGDLEAAAGVLALCREACSDLALEETALGERVRNALTRMHSIRHLEQAVRARRTGVTLTKR